MNDSVIDINTCLPINLKKEHLQLFEPIAACKIRVPKIKKINNAFVTHDGLVLKNGLLVDGCAFNLRGKEDNTFYYSFWKDTFEKYAVCKWGKSLPSVHLKGPQKYLLIHSKWFNYAFWVNGFLSRLIQAEEAGWLKKCKLIVPEGWREIPYVWDSLKAFDVEFEIIPEGHHLFVDNLIMPETRQWTASFYPLNIRKIRERLLPEAIKRTSLKHSADKIYLTRAKRGVRTVLNENEVKDNLIKNGFEDIAFEDYSFWDQVYIMSNAKVFVSIHGAGFTNVLFMPENSLAIELMEHDFAHYANPFPHWKLACAVGLSYVCQLCKGPETQNISFVKQKQANDQIRNQLVNRNIKVDISELSRNINQYNSIKDS